MPLSATETAIDGVSLSRDLCRGRLDIHQIRVIGQGCVAPQDSVKYATSVNVLCGSGKMHPEE
jgi:hypothetical protein